jgi:hypothetical protein
MSEDTMNLRGRHAEPETAELEPIDGTLVPYNDLDDVDTIAYADDVDLDSDPFADDLSARLAARAPRRYATRVTKVLAGLVLVAGGFLAGAQVQKHFGVTPTRTGQNGAGAAAFAGAFAGRGTNGAGGQNGAGGANAFGGGQNGGGAQNGGGQSGSNVTTGTVKLVDGSTVYVQTADGNVVTVKTNGSTAVQVTQNGALSDLSPGAQVSVEGSPGGDGVVNATKVTKAK